MKKLIQIAIYILVFSVIVIAQAEGPIGDGKDPEGDKIDSLELSQSNVTLCEGECVEITATTIGGYSVTWSNGLEGNEVELCAVAGMSNVIYVSYVTSPGRGRTIDIDTINIIVQDKPIVEKTADVTTCVDSCVLMMAPAGADQYTWSPTVNMSNMATQSPEVCPDDSIIYTYYLSMVFGECELFDTVEVTAENCNSSSNHPGNNNGAGEGEGGNTPPTGISTVSGNTMWNIYPNPVKDQLYIHFSEKSVLDINISDILGRTVYINKNLSKNMDWIIDMNGFDSGIYFVRLVNSQTGNVIIQRISKE